MKRTMLQWSRLLPVLALTLMAASPAQARRLDVEVWTDRGDDAVYQPGETMLIKARTTDDAYLLVYEISSEGDVRVLYPWKRSNGFVEARRTYRLPPEGSGYELAVEQATGQGFIVAIASQAPFRDLPWFLRPYDPQAASVGYEDTPEGEEGFDRDGRVVGDPYVAMERIRRRVLDRATDTEAFASAYVSFYVHEPVRYPRYICNDCHRPGLTHWWNGFDPYYTSCRVFDFRVNWAWCWGPPIWQSSIPYYYYVVRSDCPPRYRPYSDGRSRWSAWDGWKKWDNLWGGELRRYKKDPPVGYTPPPPRGSVWRKGEAPPGLLPVSSEGGPKGQLGYRKPPDSGDPRPPVWRRGGEGVAGDKGGVQPRVKPSEGGESQRPVWRRDGGGSMPSVKPRDGDAAPRGRWENWGKPAPRREPAQGGGEEERKPVWDKGRDRGEDRPRSEPPRVEPRSEPRHEPRFEPQRRNDPPPAKQAPPSGKAGRGGKGADDH